MESITFRTKIHQRGTITVPPEVALPEGEVEVTVRSTGPDGDPLAATRAWLLQMAKEAERLAPPLPEDLAERHDHYAHGKAQP